MGNIAAIQVHSLTYFKNRQRSAKAFYEIVEEMIGEHPNAGLNTQRLKLSEGGLFSPGKEYLCIKRKHYVYNVCAMPFGNSFMITWWINEAHKSSRNLINKIPFAERFFQKKERVNNYEQLDMELLFMESIDALIKEAITRIKTKTDFKHTGAASAPDNTWLQE